MARWPEIRVPDNYIGLFETDSGFLRSELAIKTWIQLAKEAGCAQLFNCPVTAIRHDDDGVTIETADGYYQAKKAIVCAGTWVKDLLPELPVQPIRKVFAWYQADGRYSVKNKFPAFTGELPNGDQYYGFPARKRRVEDWQNITEARLSIQRMNVFRLRKWSAMVRKPSRSCAMYCRVSVAACTALPAPMIIRLTKILLSIPYPATIIHCSLPA